MKFALASHGTRGDIEPCAAVGLEPPAGGMTCAWRSRPSWSACARRGLAAVPYGLDFVELMDPEIFRNAWKIQNPLALLRKAMEPVTGPWAELSAVLKSLADGVDLLFRGVPYQEAAANVAEYYRIPFAALHTYPQRVNGYVVPIPPLPFAPPRR